MGSSVNFNIEPENVEIQHLLDHIVSLNNRMDALSSRIADLERDAGRDYAQRIEQESALMPEDSEGDSREQFAAQDKVWDVVGRETLLPRIAAVCFMLVAALILRTITDNGIIGLVSGSLIGLSYASLLVLWGWKRYRNNNPLAPVFPICGAFLLFAIVLETHARFESLSTFWSYFVLIVAEVILTTMGFKFKSKGVLYMGTLGVLFSGLAIDFPSTPFIYVMVLLFTDVIVADLANRNNLTTSLRWTVLSLAVFIWLFWAYKLSVPLARDATPAAALAQFWFYPYLLVYLVCYMSLSLHRIFTKDEPLGFYNGLNPTINAFLVFGAAYIVGKEWFHNIQMIGWAATVIALLHYFFAALMAKRKKFGAPGCNAFSFAGSVYLVFGLSQAIGMLWAIPVIAITALGLAVLSGRWESGGVRLTSYILQLLAGFMVFAALPKQLNAPGANAVAAGVLFVMAFLQYQWCRKNKPARVDSAYFSWLDKHDYGAVILLLSGLVGGFGIMRLGLFLLLSQVSGETGYAFSCGQSVLVNIGAILLMVTGSRMKNSEMLIVAIAVIFLGAVRVFVFDLFGTKGLPLVVSVFSFGLVAAVGSVTFRKWQEISNAKIKMQRG